MAERVNKREWEILQCKREPHLIFSNNAQLLWFNENSLKTFPHLFMGSNLNRLSFPFPHNELLHSFDLLQKGLSSTSLVIREIHSGPESLMYFVEMFSISNECVLMVFHDLRNEKQSSLENRELLARLSTKNQFYLDMMHILSHDLRAPLSNVIGLTELLKINGGRSKEKETKSLGLIEVNAKKVISMLSDVFDMVMEERFEAVYCDVNLDSVTQKAISLCTDNPKYPSVHLSTEPLGQIVADIMYAERCLSNVIENAFKYLKGTEGGAVSIRKAQARGWVGVEIEDNGVGIPDDYLDKIFDIEFRFAKEDVKGSGLGLYMVKKWMEKMGGKIEVESTHGVGTKVWLWFLDK